MSASYEAAVVAIDAANAEDPNHVVVRGDDVPLALAHGRLAAEWIDRLVPDADDTLRLAARGHHLRRWELPRSSYPEGKAGYLRWRRDQKQRHAGLVRLFRAGFGRLLIQMSQLDDGLHDVDVRIDIIVVQQHLPRRQHLRRSLLRGRLGLLLRLGRRPARRGRGLLRN